MKFVLKVLPFLIVFYVGYMWGEDSAYEKMTREMMIEDELLMTCIDEYVELAKTCRKTIL